MQPDLVLLDREENRRETFEALEDAGVPTWVSAVRSVREVPDMLRSLGTHTGLQSTAERRACRIEALLDQARALREQAASTVAVPLIWHEPLMAVAPRRYAGDLVRSVGFEVPDFDPGDNGYPEIDPAMLAHVGVEELLLTSEPHAFTPAEGQAIVASVVAAGGRRPRARLVDGEALTWFGTGTERGLAWWIAFRAAILEEGREEALPRVDWRTEA